MLVPLEVDGRRQRPPVAAGIRAGAVWFPGVLVRSPGVAGALVASRGVSDPTLHVDVAGWHQLEADMVLQLHCILLLKVSGLLGVVMAFTLRY